MDSVNSASDSFREYNKVGKETNPINAKDTTEHGHGIAQLLSTFAGDVKTHFYQTIHSDGKFRDRDLIQTLGVIRHVVDEIDIINLSAGLDHAARPGKECTSNSPSCKVCRIISDILDEQTVFVAASGDQHQTDGLVCPGISSEVIATGGTVAKCTAASNVEIGNTPLGPDPEPRPPNAFWIDRTDEKGAQGTYCSNRGCLPGTDCMENREYEPWKHNHPPTNAAPDVLAPIHYPIEDKKGALLAEGSSFSAPIVSSQIALALSRIRTMDVNPDKNQIKKYVTERTKGCFNEKPGMLCGVEFAKGLGEPFNLEFEVEDDSEVFFTSLRCDSEY